MTDLEKEDFLFWFYSAVYVDALPPEQALDRAAGQLGLNLQSCRDYLKEDQRLDPVSGALIAWKTSAPDDDGVFPDFDWMAEILIRQGKRKGPALVEALGTIFKLSPQDTTELLSQIRLSDDSEGE